MRSQARLEKLMLTALALLGLGAAPSVGQSRRGEQHPIPRPSRQEPSRPSARPEPPRSQPEPGRSYQPPRPYEPPKEGHHSGQWLSRHREQSFEQQRQALEKDPQFRRLPADRQQSLEKRLEHFNNLPPERQQQVLERMEKWEHLTAQQKQQFRSTDSQFRNLAPERQQAVRNAIQTLRAMPPDARQRALESGKFSHFSPQEQQVLTDAARLPLAPAQETESGQSSPEPRRDVPRPPR